MHDATGHVSLFDSLRYDLNIREWSLDIANEKIIDRVRYILSFLTPVFRREHQQEMKISNEQGNGTGENRVISYSSNYNNYDY